MKRIAFIVAAIAAGVCRAGNGSWNVDANGNWGDSANWTNGEIADGAGSTARFEKVLTAGRTVTINGADGSPTVGTLFFGSSGNGVTLAASNNGFLTLDNGTLPALITTISNVPGTTISAPLRMTGSHHLQLNNKFKGDRTINLSGKISGTNVVVENIGEHGDSVFQLSGSSDFTGEVWASSIGRLNVAVNDVYETALGDPRNILRIFPNARLTLNRYGHAIVNPLRTIVLESDGTSALPRFYNAGEGNEKKHVPAPMTGEGGILVNANIVLSGANDFKGMLNIEGGTTYVASLANLGTGTLRIQGNGVTFGILGRVLSSFGNHNADFTVGNNGGTTMAIMDPENVFTFDHAPNLTLNSGGAASLSKGGPGELVFTVPQRFSNATGRFLSLGGGTVTVDYAAGASLFGASVNNQNRVGFQGGTLLLRAAGATNDVVQYLGDFKLDGDGGVLRIDQGNTGKTFTLNIGNFTALGHAASGGALWIQTLGNPDNITLTSTEPNNATTGIIGSGRVVFQEDWPVADPVTKVVSPFTDYIALPTSDADPAVNALVQGDATVSGSQTVNTLKIAPTQSGQSLTLADDATLTLANGALLFTGPHDYTLSGGKIRSNRAAPSDFFLHHAGTGTLTLNTTLASGNGISTFTKTGPGKVILAKDLRIGGQTTIASGVLEISSNENLNQASGTLTSVTSSTSSPLVTCGMETLPDGFVVGSSLLGSTVSALVLDDFMGQWDITLNNNANANITVANANFSTSGTLRNNGTLRVTESITIGRTMVHGGNGATFDIADNKTVILSGGRSGGVMILDNTDPQGNGIVRVNTTIEMGSGLFIRRGIYEAGAGNGIASCGSNPLSFGNGDIAAFRVYGNNKKVLVAELSSANPSAVVENGASGNSLFAVLNGGDNLFAGTLRDGALGTLRFLKAGGGKLTLTGASTYSGTTELNGGILELNGSIASATTLNRGSLIGTGTLNGNLAINTGATLFPTTPTPRVTGDITLSGALEIKNLETLAPGIYNLFTCDGSAINNDATLANESASRYRCLLTASNQRVDLNVIVPATLFMVR